MCGCLSTGLRGLNSRKGNAGRTVHALGDAKMQGQDPGCAPARAAVAMAHTTATGVDSTSAQGHAVTRICSARYTQCCTKGRKPSRQPQDLATHSCRAHSCQNLQASASEPVPHHCWAHDFVTRGVFYERDLPPAWGPSQYRQTGMHSGAHMYTCQEGRLKRGAASAKPVAET